VPPRAAGAAPADGGLRGGDQETALEAAAPAADAAAPARGMGSHLSISAAADGGALPLTLYVPTHSFTSSCGSVAAAWYRLDVSTTDGRRYAARRTSAPPADATLAPPIDPAALAGELGPACRARLTAAARPPSRGGETPAPTPPAAGDRLLAAATGDTAGASACATHATNRSRSDWSPNSISQASSRACAVARPPADAVTALEAPGEVGEAAPVEPAAAREAPPAAADEAVEAAAALASEMCRESTRGSAGCRSMQTEERTDRVCVSSTGACRGRSSGGGGMARRGSQKERVKRGAREDTSGSTASEERLCCSRQL